MQNSAITYDLTDVKEFNYLMNKIKSNTSIDDDDDDNMKKLNICLKNENYKVIRYSKDYLSIDLIPSYGLFRSVILNKDNRVVSFAPAKSLHSDTFIKKYREMTCDVVAEEFVEGTMINIFWDPGMQMWEIATRNSVGANSYFYKNNSGKTFREMFLECCKSVGLEYSMLDTNYCYSFVMQHPENRIVVPFLKPELYLVQVCKINQAENENENENENKNDNKKSDKEKISVVIENMEMIKQMNVWQSTSIKFPKIYKNEGTYGELIDQYASMNTSYDILGVVIRNITTNERCKIRNPVYEEVRHLRGNQPKLQYQYLCLRKNGKVKEFLNFYPEYKKELSFFRDQVHLFTNTLFQNYISCYIKKEKPLLEFPSQYKTHMFTLHDKYLNDLKEKALYVTRSLVIDYINNMHPSKLMFSLNFTMRKRSVDFINVSANEFIV